MKKQIFIAIILIFTLSQTLSQFCFADKVSHRNLSEKLLIIMEAKENQNKYIEMIKNMNIAQIQKMAAKDKDMPEEAKKIMKEHSEKSFNLIFDELSWDKMKSDYITIYVNAFTEAELQDMINFFDTPTGKKYIKQTPEIMQKSMGIAQVKMQKIMPMLESMIGELQEKLQKLKKTEKNNKTK